MRLLLLLFLAQWFGKSRQLQCYHCINQLASSDITMDEKNALKMALFARFNIPPSSEYCADGGSELLFRTVAKETCPGVNDTCIRIISEGDDDKKLVLRGCQSTLIKNGYNLVTNHSCRHGASSESSECISSCQEPLCNISHAPPLTFLLIVTGLAFIN